MLELLALGIFIVKAIHHSQTHSEASIGESLARGALWGGGAYLGGRALQAAAEQNRVATRPRVFMPHHHGPDGEAKNAIALAGESGDFGFEFDDVSVKRRINSRDPSRIRADLTRRVRQADKLMVVVGRDTHARPYVGHEIDVALAAGKPIVAVKLHRSFQAPPQLYGAGVAWASPRPASIERALAKV